MKAIGGYLDKYWHREKDWKFEEARRQLIHLTIIVTFLFNSKTKKESVVDIYLHLKK